MTFRAENPVIVQSDKTILLETHSAKFEEARDALSGFAELVKSPEHIHTYRVTPLSLWNAAALGWKPAEVKQQLLDLSKYEVPGNVMADVDDYMSRYGRLKLVPDGENLAITSDDPIILAEICLHRLVAPFLMGPAENGRVLVKSTERGFVKHALIQVGYPVEDLAGYEPGTPLDVDLVSTSGRGNDFGLRPYQVESVDAFYAGGSERGGSGVVSLPCGAGKTVVGIGAMAKVKAESTPPDKPKTTPGKRFFAT